MKLEGSLHRKSSTKYLQWDAARDLGKHCRWRVVVSVLNYGKVREL